jgi:hypothetical protein
MDLTPESNVGVSPSFLSWEHISNRILEIFPGALAWSALILPVFLSFPAPYVVAYFIICYDLWWLIRSLNMTRYLFIAHFHLQRNLEMDWKKKCESTKDLQSYYKYLLILKKRLKQKNPFLNSVFPSIIFNLIKEGFLPTKRVYIQYRRLQKESNQVKKLIKQKDIKNWKDIYHVVILATYKEELSTLRPSLQALVDAHYPKDKLFFVLACEERDRQRAEKNAAILRREFAHKFSLFLVTFHPKDIPGEVKGKGSNITYAAKQLKKIIDRKKIDYENIIATTLDADHRVHPIYFYRLTYTYITTPKRTKKSYQPLPFFHNNIWDAPAASRLLSQGCSFWFMIESVRSHRLRNFSAHAQSFKTLIDTNYWSTTTIVEDGHQFWRTFARYDGDHSTIPLFVPIYQDAVLGKTYLQTYKNQYLQHRRWAWGVTDIPYFIKNCLPNPKIPLWKKIYYLPKMIEGSFSWATAPLFLTITGWLPIILNPAFRYTVLAYNLPRTCSFLLTCALLGLLGNLYISLTLLPPRPPRYSPRRTLGVALQWIWAPPISIFLSAFPALDAQTRLMLGKYLEFWTTPKVVKK